MKGSMMGSDCKKGYNSHFSIIDTKDYFVFRDENSATLQDEIVTFNKSQALPIAFIYAKPTQLIDTSPVVKVEERIDNETGELQRLKTTSFKCDDPGSDYCLIWIDPNFDCNEMYRHQITMENRHNKKINFINLICLDHLRVYIEKYEEKLKELLKKGNLRIVSNGYRTIDGGNSTAINTSSFIDTRMYSIFKQQNVI